MTSNGFEIVCSDEMMKKLEAHCFSETKVEVGGFILGHIEGEKATVTAVLPAKQAVGQSTQLTFTHESWNVFHEESKGLDGTLIGWFHSHPNFGVFLSDHDKFIQENFFKQDGNITIVIDPIRGRRGWFYSSNGKIVKYGKESDTTREKLGRSSTNADENIEVVMGQSSGNVTMGKVLLIAFMSTVLGGFLGYTLSNMSNVDTTGQRIEALEYSVQRLADKAGVNLDNNPAPAPAGTSSTPKSSSPSPKQTKSKSPSPTASASSNKKSASPEGKACSSEGKTLIAGFRCEKVDGKLIWKTYVPPKSESSTAGN